MKRLILLFLLGLSLTASIVYFSRTDEKKREENPAKPYEHFAEMRSYPELTFDIKAYENVLLANSQQKTSMAATAGTWQVEGPHNIGGRITCLAVHPTNTNVIFIGTPGAGIFKTTNGGANWMPVFDNEAFLYIGAITFDPNNPNTIYAGTGDPDVPFTVFTGNGMFKSTDGGNTWTNIGLANTKIISEIVVNPSNSNEIFVSAMGNPIVADNNRGVYKSSDGGNSWNQVLFVNNQTGFNDVVINPTNPSILYACSYTCIRNATVNIRYSTDVKIFKTTDGGANWNALSGGLPTMKLNKYSICLGKQNPDVIYAAVSDTTYSMYGVYKSSNGGASFSNMGNNGIASNYGGFGWYFNKIECATNNDNEVYIAGVELYKTNDGGANWTINMPSWWMYDVHADIHAITTIAPGKYFLGTDGGTYLTTDDGANYTDIDNIPNTQFYRVEYNPHQPNNYWGGAQDNGTTYGNLSSINNWIREFGGDGFQPRFHPTNPNEYYVETQNGGLYVTVDGGSNWDYHDNNIDVNDRRNWDMPYVLNKQNPLNQYTGTYRVYKNSNGPVENWTPISGDLTDGNILGDRFHNISAIDNSELAAQTIYVGTSDANVWVTTNDGGNWTNITGTLPNRYVTSVHASPNVISNVYVTHTGYKYNEYIPHIHKSTNNGTTWIDISGNLPQSGINDVLIMPGNENNLFVATDIGVYGTYDGGVSWHRIGNNMPSISVWDISLNPALNRLIAGTYAKSIQSLDVNVITTELKNRTLASNNFILFPSVTNTVVKISSEARIGRYQIFDATGKMLISGSENGNELEVSVTGLACGVYYFKAESNNTVKKFIKY
ncbi:MAG: T9SS type A sorting domain-containing protein [Bacteroidia bacterium]